MTIALLDEEATAMAERARAASDAELAALRASYAMLVRYGEALALAQMADADRLRKPAQGRLHDRRMATYWSATNAANELLAEVSAHALTLAAAAASPTATLLESKS